MTAIKPKNARYAQEALSLPRQNSAEYIQEVLVPAGTRLQRSRALPIKQANDIFPVRRGGGEQFEIIYGPNGKYIPVDSFGDGVPFQ